MKNCELCGKETLNKRYCSRQCSAKTNGAWQEVDVISKKCLFCSKIFTIRTNQEKLKRRIFCSSVCYNGARKLINLEDVSNLSSELQNFIIEQKKYNKTRAIKEENKAKWKEDNSKSHKDFWSKVTPEYLEVKSKKTTEANLKWWREAPEEKKRARLKKMFARVIPSRPEEYFEALCQNYSLPFKYVGNGELIIGSKNPDFVSLVSSKELVEIYGDYYHKGEDPQERVDYFKVRGYNCLVIWASELRNEDLVMNKVLNYLLQCLTEEECKKLDKDKIITLFELKAIWNKMIMGELLEECLRIFSSTNSGGGNDKETKEKIIRIFNRANMDLQFNKN